MSYFCQEKGLLGKNKIKIKKYRYYKKTHKIAAFNKFLRFFLKKCKLIWKDICFTYVCILKQIK